MEVKKKKNMLQEKVFTTLDFLNAENPFSGVIWLDVNGETIFTRAYGLASRRDAIPNNLETRFQTASGTKIFTALAVLQLVEQGLLKLEDRLKDILPFSFPNFSPEITLRHLLTHTSGITSYFEEDVNDDYEALWQDLPVYRMREPRDFLPLFQNKGMKFSPGERFEYNDGGFILLGLVIEQVSGKSFREVIREQVFLPAGMQNSGFYYSDRLPSNTAEAYIYDKERKEWRSNIFSVPIIGAPDGGAYTSAADLCSFWKALLDHKLLSEENTRQMLTPQAAEDEEKGFYYGSGVWIRKTEEQPMIFYVEGMDPGASMISACAANRAFMLHILGNTNRSVWQIYRAVTALLKD